MGLVRIFLLSSVTILLSSAVGAIPLESCPDISGTYLCRENSYRKDTLYTFSRNIQHGFWNYTMKAHSPQGPVLSIYDFLANDQEQIVKDQVTGQTLTLKASCQSQLLKVKGTFRAPNGATILFSEDLSLTEQKDLSNVSLDINGQVVQEICERQL
jgi:hypothetical protein